MRLTEITPEFVWEIPRELEFGKLYLALQYRAVMHLCACGCGAKISTPLHPTGWQLTCDGETATLHPSVGNWSEECRSHYIIRKNRVIWSYALPKHRIEEIRQEQRDDIEDYFAGKSRRTPPVESDQEEPAPDPEAQLREGFLQRLARTLGFRRR